MIFQQNQLHLEPKRISRRSASRERADTFAFSKLLLGANSTQSISNPIRIMEAIRCGKSRLQSTDSEKLRGKIESANVLRMGDFKKFSKGVEILEGGKAKEFARGGVPD